MSKILSTEKKFEAILIEEGASRALLEKVEKHAGLGRLARRIRTELNLPQAPRRPRQVDPRQAVQVLSAAKAADDARLAAGVEALAEKWGAAA